MKSRDKKRQFWEAQFNKQIESGKTIQQFCQDEKLNSHVFQYWSSKQRREQKSIETVSQEETRLTFLPVQIERLDPQDGLLLQHASGFTLRITDSSDLNLLKTMLFELGSQT